MAELSDVYNAVVALVAGALYPNGTTQPSAITAGVKIYPRWPNSTELDADLRAGLVHVTIYPPPNMERVTTRNPRDWVDQFKGVPTITATVSGSTVTIGGTVTAGNYVSIVCNNKAFSYVCLVTDTAQTVAAALGALVAASLPCLVSGAVITIYNRTDIAARCAAPGTIMQEVRRQNRALTVSIWAPTPQLRDATAAIVDPILAVTDFIALPDTTQAWLIYRGTNEFEDSQKAMLYRRDINIWAEYPTIITAIGYPITIGQIQLNTADGTQSGLTLTQIN